ncbi:MAG: TerB family tellurite resistance protein [Bacteroidetes bacterium]|nr:TerB family tellurite resistance protein [Bacteroidota bacterium]
MKKIIIILFLAVSTAKASAQAEELQQLALNIEKLAQFKQILSDLKKAYEILYGGYTTIKNISEGNFSLHQTFLDGLLKVSPAVQKYKKVADIISLQLQLVKEYKAAFTRFKNNNWFRQEEIDYIARVYSNLFKQSLQHLDDLATVLTANQLRMTDDERLKRIDQIYSGMQDKMVFLRHFNSNTSILSIQRSKEKSDVDIIQKLHDVK